MKDFTNWIPLRIYWNGDEPWVDWGYLGTKRFTEPFFNNTINSCVQHPADVLFRHQTRLEDLEELAESRPSVAPTGFIYHMSRCGSTLISQMLAAAPSNIVLSEPAPVDLVLREHYQDPRISDEQRMRWLKAMVKVLFWRRFPEEQNGFIKFDCWHIMLLPLIQKAFPEVPWIYLYREPLEVMASAQMQLGGQMFPGVLNPALFGWDTAQLSQMQLYEYAARVLGKLCEAAQQHLTLGQGKLVNYSQLPMSVWPELLRHWNVSFSTTELDVMQSATGAHAKNPTQPFKPDNQFKQNFVTPENRQLVKDWMTEPYLRLELLRKQHGFT